MLYCQSIILGIIQGATEFLPISSSGHLVLTPYIFGWDYRGLSFDIALHLGTLLAIVFYFWHDIVSIVMRGLNITHTDPFRRNDTDKNNETMKQCNNDKDQEASGASATRNSQLVTSNFPKNFLWQMILATLPAIAVGYFLSDIVDNHLHSPLLIAINLAFFGIVLLASDHYRKKANEAIEAISYRSSFVIGLFQAISLMPGVSRSGITMTAGRFLGYSKEAAARLSFLIGIPATAGAFLYEARRLSASDINLANLIALAVTIIVGFLTIKYLLQYLKRGSFAVFAVYRLLLAFVVLAFYLLRG
jgi:undecaprenyl-diphosphatase